MKWSGRQGQPTVEGNLKQGQQQRDQPEDDTQRRRQRAEPGWAGGGGAAPKNRRGRQDLPCAACSAGVQRARCGPAGSDQSAKCRLVGASGLIRDECIYQLPRSFPFSPSPVPTRFPPTSRAAPPAAAWTGPGRRRSRFPGPESPALRRQPTRCGAPGGFEPAIPGPCWSR